MVIGLGNGAWGSEKGAFKEKLGFLEIEFEGR